MVGSLYVGAFLYNHPMDLENSQMLQCLIYKFEQTFEIGLTRFAKFENYNNSFN
jgi:hypothetical protein